MSQSQAALNKKNLVTALDLYKKGAFDRALPLLQKVSHAEKNNVAAFYFLGLTQHALGRWEDAQKSLIRVLRLKPGWFDALFALSACLTAGQEWADALKINGQALQQQPNHAGILSQRAMIFLSMRQEAEGLKCAEKALKIDPNDKKAWLNKGACLMALERYVDAIPCFENAIKRDSGYALAYRNLAGAYMEYGRAQGRMAEMYEKAINAFDKALSLNPDDAVGFTNRASLKMHLGFQEDGLGDYQKSLKLNPYQPAAHSDYILGMHYVSRVSAETLFEELKRWEDVHCKDVQPADIKTFKRERVPEKLKIGMVSRGFRRHPVGYMVLKGVQNLPKNEFALHFYADMKPEKQDSITARLKETAAQWSDVFTLDDISLRQKIIDDGIDILFDMTGHSELGSRLRVFAARAAPVQVKWVGGLFSSSGLKEMDWLLADAVQVPEGFEKYYSEKIYRMPDDYICYVPPEHDLQPNDLPAVQNGYMTFGNLNHVAKTNDESIDLWSGILETLPESRLILKTKGVEIPAVQKRILSRFEHNGIDPSRIELEGGAPHKEFLEVYNRIDVALDPVPYSGGLTTCEALWMGVPVITLPGITFASRHAATHLAATGGLDDWIINSKEAYIQRAVDASHDLDGLNTLRHDLRGRMLSSPLTDGARYGENFGLALRKMWDEFAQEHL